MPALTGNLSTNKLTLQAHGPVAVWWAFFKNGVREMGTPKDFESVLIILVEPDLGFSININLYSSLI